jgi:hypothetical protein
MVSRRALLKGAARLYRAYGPATDYQANSMRWRDHDQARRGQALSELFGNVYHLGNRWQASAVVPFLVALVADAGTADRADILDLLTTIAIGDRRDDALPFDPAFAAPRDLVGIDSTELIRRFYAEEDLGSDEIDLLDAAAVGCAADTYDRTAGFPKTITGLLTDPDEPVAAGAAALPGLTASRACPWWRPRHQQPAGRGRHPDRGGKRARHPGRHGGP